MNPTFLRYFYIAFIFSISLSCSTAPKLRKIENSMFELSTQTVSSSDSSVIKMINPYKVEMEKIMNEVLVYSNTALLKGVPESNLGDFVSDAVLKKTNDKYKPSNNHPADICLLNNGGLRGQLPKGNITRGNAFELMPFENSIVVLTLSGKKTKQLFEYIVESNGAPFAGATVKAKGKKIVEVKIHGQDLDSTKTYKVCTSDYLATGGDKYNFFKNPIKIDTVNYKLRDAIIDYMVDEKRKGATLNISIDGRIKYE